MLSANLIAIGHDNGFEVFDLDILLNENKETIENPKPVKEFECGKVQRLQLLNENQFLSKNGRCIKIWDFKNDDCIKAINL